MNKAAIFFLFVVVSTANLQSFAKSPQTVRNSRAEDRKSDNVFLLVSITSKKTLGFVEGLKKEDLSIYEDDIKQDITEFSQIERSLSIILLLDVSGSMRTFLPAIKEVARDVLQQLKPDDQIALISFAENTKLISDFTKNRKFAGDKIDELSQADIYGKTFLDPALHLAVEHLRKSAPPNTNRIIITITDDLTKDSDKSHPVKEVLQEINESGIVVCGLIMPEPKLPQNLFRKNDVHAVSNTYAKETGGMILPLEDKEARIKLGRVIENLRMQYSVTYAPSSARPDRKPPKIKIKISPNAEKRAGNSEVRIKRVS